MRVDADQRFQVQINHLYTEMDAQQTEFNARLAAQRTAMEFDLAQTVAAKNALLEDVRAIACSVCEASDNPVVPGPGSPEDDLIVATCTGPKPHGICKSCFTTTMQMVATDQVTPNTCGMRVADDQRQFGAINGQRCNAPFCIKPSVSHTLYTEMTCEMAVATARREAFHEKELAVRALNDEKAVLVQRLDEMDVDQGTASMTELNLALRGVKTPCCGTNIIGFHQCAVVRCLIDANGRHVAPGHNTCGRSFCAWCWHVMGPGEDGHNHVYYECPVNPTRFGSNGNPLERGHLYAYSDHLKTLMLAIWRKRQLEQACQVEGVEPLLCQLAEAQ